jgi:putative SOS response-associated peptidase YedK
MCYHKSLTTKYEQLAEYYAAQYSDVVAESYTPRFHENGFDFFPTPIVTAGRPNELQMFHWGLVPFWTKDLAAAQKLRISTLNCISEEMFEKPAFKDAIKEGKRCLIPCTGFMEWKWLDEKGKTKIPHYIDLSDQSLFSIAGVYSRWKNKDTDQYYYSYTVLTTKANSLMDEIHNSKHRMPVIIPREYEKDWLNPNLTKEDVLALCQPIDASRMKAHTISKLITTKGADTNVAEVLAMHDYEKINSK